MKKIFISFFLLCFAFFSLNAQIDRSFTNTLGNFNSNFAETFISELIDGNQTIKNSNKSFSSVESVVSYVEGTMPNYINIDEYLVNRPNHELAATVSNLINSSSSAAEFAARLRSLPTQNLSYNDKSFLAAMDYTAQFLQNQSIRYVNSPGGNNVMEIRDFTVINWWRCAAAVAGGAILGGLEGAAVGSALPGLGTTAGGIIGAIGGGLAGAAAGC